MNEKIQGLKNEYNFTKNEMALIKSGIGVHIDNKQMISIDQLEALRKWHEYYTRFLELMASF